MSDYGTDILTWSERQDDLLHVGSAANQVVSASPTAADCLCQNRQRPEDGK